MLLILTSREDLTADYLIVDLIRRNLGYFRLNAEDLASADFYYALDGSGVTRRITVGPRTLDLDEVHAVWYRRAVHPGVSASLSAAERAFVGGELRHLALGLLLNSEVIWVNAIEKVSVAEHKLYQLQVARRCGLRVPRTIVSGNSGALREFVATNAAGTICKPIFHGLFFDTAAQYAIYTRRVDANSLDPGCGNPCPILLQEEIVRKADVRATFIGTRCYVADILSKEPIIDWRVPDTRVEYVRSTLSDSVQQACRRVMEELGLLYGAFDFIRTPDGELVFLEINPTGEWAWLEETVGFPMRDAFIELFWSGGA